MTKNELLKRIVELGYTHTYDELRDKLRISTISEPSSYYISIGTYDFKVHDGYVVSSERSKKLVRYILDYLDTPIEEREEEKKYHLRFPKGYNSWYSYLAKEINKDNGEYDCSGKCIDNEKYKNIFTQKEIDEMPFDTNFFVKEEVK
jgi:hypothetical protein